MDEDMPLFLETCKSSSWEWPWLGFFAEPWKLSTIPLFWMDTDSPPKHVWGSETLSIIFTAMSHEVCLPGLAVSWLKTQLRRCRWRPRTLLQLGCKPRKWEHSLMIKQANACWSFILHLCLYQWCPQTWQPEHFFRGSSSFLRICRSLASLMDFIFIGLLLTSWYSSSSKMVDRLGARGAKKQLIPQQSWYNGRRRSLWDYIIVVWYLKEWPCSFCYCWREGDIIPSSSSLCQLLGDRLCV